MANSVCRVCLISNIRMLNINNIHLLEIYEKLTNTKLNAGTEYEMPSTICYVCHRQLQRCFKFSDMAQKSNRILRDLLHNGDAKTHTALTTPTLEIMQNLSVTPTEHIYINEDSYLNEDSSITSITPINIKEEKIIVIKEETADNIEIHDEPLNMVTLDGGVDIGDDSIDTKPPQENGNKVRANSDDLCDAMDSKYNLVKDLNNPYTCNTCSKEFTDKSTLIRHMQYHTDDKPYSCNMCEKAFSRLGNLTNHIRVHSKERPFTCYTCYKTFTDKTTYTRHTRSHTREKSYFCIRCDKAFTTQTHLSRHIRTHTGDRPFKCSLCDKTFTVQSNLTVHMRIHTGEKPYSCKICDKAFNQGSHLTSHMRLHTGEKPYSCDRCDKSFAQQSNLRNHILIHVGKM